MAWRFAIDERSTVEDFYGKTIEETQALFAGNFLWYSDELSVLPVKAFSFYVVAATNYLRSPESTGDPDSVNGFCHMLEHRLKHPKLGLPVDALPNIRSTITSIVNDFGRFDADVEIYGDLIGRYRILADRVAA
jgi:hypothetical protein